MGRPVLCSTGPGSADADREQVARRTAELVEQVVAGLRHPAEHGLGALGDLDGFAALGLQATGQVADGDAHVRRADVDAEHDSAARRDRELRRRPATGRDRVADRADEPEIHEGVDAEGDGGAGEARHRGKLGASAWAAVAEDLEQVARNRGAEGGDVPVARFATYVGHSLIIPCLLIKGATLRSSR